MKARICYNCRGPLEPSRKLLCLKCESTNPYEEAKPVESEKDESKRQQAIEALKGEK